MLHHSMIELPEQPMKPRRYDDRVGFFTVSFEDYGSPKQEVEKVQYITRWRLEKKDPKAAVSEPKKPIVFYIGREVPGEVAALDQEGDRGLAAGVREGRLQERHHRQGAAQPAAKTPTGTPRTPAIRRSAGSPPPSRTPMGPHVHDPQDRRDPRGRHPHVSQHPEARPRLVLRPGLAQRPEGPDRCPCPTT